MGQREATFMIHEMVFDPTELGTLGAVFDETWDAFTTEHPALSLKPEIRFRLASLVLRLARDHQLGQDQIKATALRLLTHDEPALLATR